MTSPPFEHSYRDGFDEGEPQSIRLMHHDARWKQEFEQTRSNLLQSCQGHVTRVEHVGGTSISGLIAQPIIDVVALVPNLSNLDAASLHIEGLNFRVVDSPDWLDHCLVLQKPRHGTPTHQVFLMTAEHPAVDRLLLIRDFLRNDAEEAMRFESQKVNLWKASEGDPEQYSERKSAFFAKLEAHITEQD
ncbi:GrpB family protein [Rhodopirellula sp. JC740]|uniref:GrpB family protein n=1 Tax=Rhodopirellula halodulae TaxID=2894198 RepID=A0ABS8NFF6_9BACT|nr:GrpB family protein [Rhodopirellula sp. JC740]MCC9641563.1 GrpB family protein [Rhodopirellula sp. JC740]